MICSDVSMCSLSFRKREPHFASCENGATCINPGLNNYTCTCMVGYEGYNCSIGNLDHLPSIPPTSREESYIVLNLIPYLAFN